MGLSELQIERYARHILLPEVGGVGQERLCAARVSVRGPAPFAELAGDYLRAAGCQVSVSHAEALSLAFEGAGVAVRREGASILVVASACEACRGASGGDLDLESGTVAACAAACELLRQVLGQAPACRAWVVNGGGLAHAPAARCPAHRGAA